MSRIDHQKRNRFARISGSGYEIIAPRKRSKKQRQADAVARQKAKTVEAKRKRPGLLAIEAAAFDSARTGATELIKRSD